MLAAVLMLSALFGAPPAGSGPIPAPPGGASATTATSTASPPVETGSAPKREIVYKVDEANIVRASGTDYGGTTSNVGTAGNEGTLTIDILQVYKGDILGVRATERWRSEGAKTLSATGYIGPDGTLTIVDGTYTPSMVSVLPYLSTGYITNHDMSVGTGWSESADTLRKEHIDRHYSITNVDTGTSTITINVNGTMTGGGMGMFPATEKDTIVYKPSMLVALSGLFETRTLSSNVSESKDSTHRFHFQRISDTRDP